MARLTPLGLSVEKIFSSGWQVPLRNLVWWIYSAGLTSLSRLLDPSIRVLLSDREKQQLACACLVRNPAAESWCFADNAGRVQAAGPRLYRTHWL